MRHPALTRFFAAFLAVASAITLISGYLCIRKAGNDRDKQNTNTQRLTEKNDEARTLRAELDAMPEAFEEKSAAYDEAKAKYDSEKNNYRKDLSIYTATESALKTAQEEIDAGYAELRMGWIQHDNSEKTVDEAEAEFLPYYEQYLSGKAQLEENKAKYEQAAALKESLPELSLIRTGLDAMKSTKSAASATIDEIRNTIQNPPLTTVIEDGGGDEGDGEGEEGGESEAPVEITVIDRDALQTQLSTQIAALSRYIGTLSAMASMSYTDSFSQAITPAASAVSEQSARIAGGTLSADELLAAGSAVVTAGQSMCSSLDTQIASAEQTVTLLESLPEMKAQLDKAEATLKEQEPTILATKQTIDDSRSQLDTAKNLLIYAEAKLIAGTKELEENRAKQEETKEDLDRRKTELEEESVRLEAMYREVEDYRDKKDRFHTLRYALLADEGIAARERAGEDLIEGAAAELTQRSADTQREYELRFAAACGMLAAAAFGLITVAAAFREKGRVGLLLCSALAFLLSAAAEGVSCYAGRGMIYTVLFVGVFGFAVLVFNLRKA